MVKVIYTQFGPMPRPRLLARLFRKEAADIAVEKLGYSNRNVIRKAMARYIDTVNKLEYFKYSDGVYWADDVLTPVARGIKSSDINGLARFYNNNFFYRQPVIKDKLIYESPPRVSRLFNIFLEILKDLDTNTSKISFTLPGPFTFYYRSLVNAYYNDPYNFAKDYINNIMLKEIEYIEKNKIRWIDIHEPELSQRSLNIDASKVITIYRDLISTLKDKDINIYIAIYFGFNYNIFKEFANKLDQKNIYVHIDLVSEPETLYRKASQRSMTTIANLCIGVFDSRNTKIEEYRFISRKIRSLMKRFQISEKICITHNAPLEFLPEVIAFRKLKIIASYSKKLKERI